MEEKFDRALTSKMKNLFQEQGDEAYEPGAWEAFEANAYSSGINPYRFLWIGLAACFLMAMSVETIYNSSYDGIIGNSPESLTEAKDIKAGSSELALDEVNIERNNLPGLGAGKREINESGAQKVPNHLFSYSYLPTFAKISTGDINSYDFSGTYEAYQSEGNIKMTYPKADDFVPFVSRPHKSVKMGFMVTSFANQYNGSQPGFNFGGGVIMDIPLIKNLSLNTGIVLAQQSINFKPSNVENSEEGNKMIVTKGRLLSFDFPINLKYSFWRKKKKEMFVTGGISSLTYAKADFEETYQTSREVKSNVYNDQGDHAEIVATVKSREYKHSSEKPFSRFNFARLLNLSVGVEVPIEEQLSLLIEPYIKYPLGSLTSKDIKFSSAGVSLKLNMGLAKVN